MERLEQIQNWYAQHCDGDSERRHDIVIATCAAHGWSIKIDLARTPLYWKRFEAVCENVADGGYQNRPRWLCCYVRNGVWHGDGDATQLPTILDKFIAWAAPKKAKLKAETADSANSQIEGNGWNSSLRQGAPALIAAGHAVCSFNRAEEVAP
jgi:Immunity protein 53